MTIYNLEACHYKYKGDELKEIYAEDYSYYYTESDLIWIATNKVVG